MVSPVLAQELLLGSRRSRHLLFRRIYAAWLVLQFLFFYWLYLINVNLIGYWVFRGSINPEALNSFAPPLVEKLVYQHFILLLLATPAFTAGAITEEKATGTLEYLLAADLTSWEILVGKLLGRVFQVAILGLAALPLLCFIGVFGGLSLIQLAGLLVVTAAPLFALGAASLLASVWSKQTRDAVLAVYLCGAVGGFLLWLVDGLYLFDPLYVLEPAWGDGADLIELARRLLLSVLAWGTVGGLCLGMATWQLRPAYLRQLEAAGRPKQARWWRARRAPVSDEPVRWKERYVEGLAPLAWMRRLPRSLGVTVIFTVTTLSSLSILIQPLLTKLSWQEILSNLVHFQFSQLAVSSGAAKDAFLTQSIVALLVATFLVGVRCSGAVTGERERQTWEALLLTPLPAPQLIRGKLRGIIGASYPYLLAYLLPALAFSVFAGGWAPFSTVLLIVVTWLAMGFVGAAGLWCSVGSKGSWRSLLWTGVIGYAGGFLLFGVAFPVAGLLWLVILLTLLIIDWAMANPTGLAQAFQGTYGSYMIGICLGLIGGFLLATSLFLRSAQKYIALRERVRQDKGMPQRSPLRQRRRRTQPAPDPLGGHHEPR